jgi:hypothetical protein
VHYFFFAVFFFAVAFVPHFFPQAIDFTSSKQIIPFIYTAHPGGQGKNHVAPETTFFIVTPVKY